MQLKQLSPGDFVRGVFLLRRVDARVARNGNVYWDLEIADRSGRLICRMFQPPDELPTGLPQPMFCEGLVERYQGRNVGKLVRLEPAEPESFHWEDLIPTTKRPLAELIDELKNRVAAIRDEWYKKLWEALLADTSWFARYCETPAGKLWHHMYRGGLLEHSLCVADHCELAAKHHALADPDLLLCGALLHDVGKVWELSPLPAADYTEAGRLLGHIYLGANFLSRKMEAIDGFPTQHKMRLLHIILAHQGKRENGSPIHPATLEAKIVHGADELDAHAEAYEHIIEANLDGQRLFTDYVALAESFLYLGDRNDGFTTVTEPEQSA